MNNKLTKIEVQQRVLKDNKPLDLEKFEWDEDTRVFTSKESYLVFNFYNIGNCKFFVCDNCIFNIGWNCTFDTDWNCTFNTGWSCIFNTGYDCVFNTGYDCVFNTSDDCVFNTNYGCFFNTGDNCTFKAWIDCIFNIGNNCSIDACNTAYINNLNNNDTILTIRDYDEIKTYNLSEYKSNKLHRFSIDSHIEKEIKEIKSIDTAIMVIINNKKLQDYQIYQTKYIQDYFNNKQEVQYVASKDGFYAHGETVKQAMNDLSFKIMNSKDVKEHIQRVKNQGYVTPNDYRLITGACNYGTNKFLEENNLDWDVKKSIEETCEMVKNQYGGQEFINLLKGE